MKYNINYGPHPDWLDVEKVEKDKSAKYIGQFCLKTKGGGWSEQHWPVFYVENPDVEKGHTHYFALIARGDQLYITAGDSAFSEPIEAIIGSDGEVLFSRSRHDFRSLGSGEGMIDGGRDYLRTMGGVKGFPPKTMLEIDGPELKVIESNNTP